MHNHASLDGLASTVLGFFSGLLEEDEDDDDDDEEDFGVDEEEEEEEDEDFGFELLLLLPPLLEGLLTFSPFSAFFSTCLTARSTARST